MTKTALIVIDIQNDYFSGGKWELTDMDKRAENAASVLADARANGELVVHVRHEFASDHAPFFAPGSKGAEINPVVAPKGDELIVVKNQINSFLDTNLKAILDENGVTDVVIVGAMSHMCIDAAARAASDFGYKTRVIHDACASRPLEFEGKVIDADAVHAAFMSALGFAYADVVSTETYLNRQRVAA